MEMDVKTESQLEGQCVVITGGSSGIGLATALRARNAGASRVVIVGRSPEKLAQAVAAIGDVADPYPLDVTDEDAVSRFFADLGPIDHLVTAAAGTYRGKITETDTVAAKALFESKYWGNTASNMRDRGFAAAVPLRCSLGGSAGSPWLRLALWQRLTLPLKQLLGLPASSSRQCG